jgi:putative oxidoreductase
MLASIFVVQGLDTMRNPQRVVPAAEPVVRPLAEQVPIVPDQTEQAVRINGAVQFVAGSLLALGRFPRLSALAIAATLVPTTYAGHRFWEVDDKQDRAHQRIHFLKNLSMFGGLLIAAADTGGNPSLAWRSRHAAETARREAALAARTAKASSKAGATAGRASAQVSRVGRVGRIGQATKGGKAGKPGKAGKAAKVRAAKISARAAKTGTRASAKAGRLTSRLPVG